MRNPDTSNSTPASSASSHSPSCWKSYKESGTRHYRNEKYDQALAEYQAALELNCPSLERQILLSNIVACRLQIGGRTMVEAAINDAKKCIAINDRWSKGHVRLASAYIALGGHSNDACNCLQRVLSIDPSNKVARQMLLHELGKARETSRSTDPRMEATAPPMEEAFPTSSSYFSVEPSAPPMETSYNMNTATYNNIRSNMSFSTSGFYATNNNPNNSFTGGTQIPPPNDYMGPNNNESNYHNNHSNDVDDSVTLYERFQFFLSRIISWYKNDLNENIRTSLKVLFALTIIYVAFGGKFGLGGSFGSYNHENRGNYKNGNAYDRYYSKKVNGDYESRYEAASGRSSTSSSSYNNGRKYSSSQYYESANDDYDYYPRGRSSHRYNQFQSPNVLNGSILSMAILAAFVYGCNRMGLNVLQVIWILNMLTGNRRRIGNFGHFGRNRRMMWNRRR